MQQTWVGPLGHRDPLEEGTAMHSSVLASRISWTEEPCRLQTVGLQIVVHDWISLARIHVLCAMGLFFNIYLFMWLCWVLAAACRILSCDMQDIVP